MLDGEDFVTGFVSPAIEWNYCFAQEVFPGNVIGWCMSLSIAEPVAGHCCYPLITACSTGFISEINECISVHWDEYALGKGQAK